MRLRSDEIGPISVRLNQISGEYQQFKETSRYSEIALNEKIVSLERERD